MANDLNQLTPVSSSRGDYGLNDPVNAWSGAGSDIIVSVSWIGTTLVQIGYDSGQPDDLWVRYRRDGEQAYSPWASLSGAIAPPDAAPVISALDPDTAELGAADVTMTITGENFTEASVIYFADQPEPIVFVSETEISTVVKPSLGWGPVTVPVKVRNGNADSNELSFTFTEAVAAEKAARKLRGEDEASTGAQPKAAKADPEPEASAPKTGRPRNTDR